MNSRILDRLADQLLLATEWSARQIYWRSPSLRSLVKRFRLKRKVNPQIADRRELKEYLAKIGVTEGALVMAHTSVSGMSLLSDQTPSTENSAGSLQVATHLLDDLLDLVGPTGTLAMPTHAIYQNSAFAPKNSSSTPIIYNPRTTPCGVGIVNEIFWRRRGVKRSLFPYNMLAAKGPLASELLQDNLAGPKPLPHGPNSGYYRLCQQNALVIGVGLRLGLCLTLLHTAEDTRVDWPIKDFYEEKEYIVVDGSEQKRVVIRHIKTDFLARSACIRKVRRDLLGAGILHEGQVGSVNVDWLRAGDLLEFLADRSKRSTYPYYFPGLAKGKAA